MASRPISRSADVISGQANLTEPGPGSEHSKGARTRARLVEEGIRQFGATGYRHTSLASVTRAAHLTPAAAYPYFPTKHDLFLECADAAVAHLLSASDGAATAPTPWLSRFAFIVQAVPDHPLVQRILADEEPDIVRQCLALPSLRAFVSELEAELSNAQQAGVLSGAIPAPDLALALESVFLGQLLFRVRSGMAEVDERASAVAMLVAQALFRPPT